ncbi:MAG: redox-regulated ATPase YchF [Spirochaetales bacterium]|nr:redox-regulated ATPase YchF [Spirochaetales bacterium]
MSLNCGIVGLPNVGKSTLFTALTATPAEAANYPFCTIDPNFGIVNVSDKRLRQIEELVTTEKVVPAVVEFVDIAGLVRGASKGEGRGNQFLSNIRNVGILVHVVRCFDNDDIIHVENKLDPLSDIETINIELALSDLETVEKRLQKTDKLMRAQDKDAKLLMQLLEKLRDLLSEGKPARSADFSEEQLPLIRDLHLITMKKVLYVCNVDENHLTEDNDYVKKVRAFAKAEGAEAISVCAKLEAEIAALETDAEKDEFLADAGLAESGLSQLIHSGYKMLGLRTFFTAGPKEIRAWTFHEGDKAPRTAGVIHTDFEKGFIKAEVYHCDDLFTYGSEKKVKEAGKLRLEGKEYLVQDGDIMHFKFNV